MNLQDLKNLLGNELKKEMGEEAAEKFIDATEHSYICRCDDCRQWWVLMGPDEGNSYGPFTEVEIEEARIKGTRNDDLG